MRGRAVLLALVVAGCGPGGSEVTPARSSETTSTAQAEAPPINRPVTELPAPDVEGSETLESALSSRRSVRDFADDDLTPAELGQLLWAAQGVTNPEGKRTAPSAGALYPLEVYAATKEGLRHYLPEGHRLEELAAEDLRAPLAEAVGQEWVGQAPAVLVVVGVESRTAAKYGDRAERYVAIETGHAAQNVLLQATTLGLVGTPVGAFEDAEVRALLGLPDSHTPLLLLPVGHPLTAP